MQPRVHSSMYMLRSGCHKVDQGAMDDAKPEDETNRGREFGPMDIGMSSSPQQLSIRLERLIWDLTYLKSAWTRTD